MKLPEKISPCPIVEAIVELERVEILHNFISTLVDESQDVDIDIVEAVKMCIFGI